MRAATGKALRTLALSLLALACAALAVLVLMLPARASASEDHPVVVSLGDSYSSGEGNEPFYGQDDEDKTESQDWLAHRSKLAWPGRLRVPTADGGDITLNEHRDENWFFVASSGAVTANLKKDKQPKPVKQLVLTQTTMGAEPVIVTKEPEPSIKLQLDVFNRIEKGTVDYVTITIGGNDAEFVPIIESTALSVELLDFNLLRDKLDAVWRKFDSEIEANLITAYHDIQAAAGKQAMILVAGYPRLLDATEGHAVIINPTESFLIDESVSDFNDRIEGIVKRLQQDENMNIEFVSVEKRFEGHEAYSNDPYINPIYLSVKAQDLDVTAPVSSYSIHPNEKGIMAYARAVQAAIDKNEDKKAGITPQVPSESGLSDGLKRDIVLVLDTSGSMAGDPIDEVNRAVGSFGETVLQAPNASEGNVRVGVVSFDSDAEVHLNLSTSIPASADLSTGGGTNMGAGLEEAAGMLDGSTADRKIVVIMTDGQPNEGMSDEELVEYAQRLKDEGCYVYTLGFFSGITPGSKSAPQRLLEKIASEGCHYEITDASDLKFFFGDIADQINGVRYNYIRIACPVDVTVTFEGETLSSRDNDKATRRSFGTLTFEDAEVGEDGIETAEDAYNAIKILRLREGPGYDISIDGTGSGIMNYRIGFVDDAGEYSDMRYFDDISIQPETHIETVAEVSPSTEMSVDYDGDGNVDDVYVAKASSHAELRDNSLVVRLVVLGFALAGIAAVLVVVRRIWKRRRAAS